MLDKGPQRFSAVGRFRAAVEYLDRPIFMKRCNLLLSDVPFTIERVLQHEGMDVVVLLKVAKNCIRILVEDGAECEYYVAVLHRAKLTDLFPKAVWLIIV